MTAWGKERRVFPRFFCQKRTSINGKAPSTNATRLARNSILFLSVVLGIPMLSKKAWLNVLVLKCWKKYQQKARLDAQRWISEFHPKSNIENPTKMRKTKGSEILLNVLTDKFSEREPSKIYPSKPQDFSRVELDLYLKLGKFITEGGLLRFLVPLSTPSCAREKWHSTIAETWWKINSCAQNQKKFPNSRIA